MAPHERGPFVREALGRKLMALEVEPLPGQPFRMDAVQRALPGLRMVVSVNSRLRVQRTRALLADGDDSLLLALPTRGMNIISQRGREVTIADGEAVLQSKAETIDCTNPMGGRFPGVWLPRLPLVGAVPGLEDALMRRIPRDNQALRLLVGYLRALDDTEALATPELRRLVVTHVYDLVSLAIGSSRDAAAIAEGRGLRAARLKAVKADIAERLGNGDLTVAEVASRHRVSPRYVQMLFEGEGTTFSQYVLNQRLARAHCLLTDPRAAGLTITAIAFEAGFSDLSHFNRTFRRLYGASPSEVRAAAHGNRQA